MNLEKIVPLSVYTFLSKLSTFWSIFEKTEKYVWNKIL